MSIINKLRLNASKTNKSIIFPDGNDERTVKAANELLSNKLCSVSLIGDREYILKEYSKLNPEHDLQVIDINDTPYLEKLAFHYYEKRKSKGETMDSALQAVKRPCYFGAAAVDNGLFDGCVAGSISSSAEVLRGALRGIGMKKGMSKISSFIILETPVKEYGSNGTFFMADIAINPYPDSEVLADIAVSTADSYRLLMEDVKKDGFRDDNPAKDVRMLAKKGKRRKPIPPSVLRILFPDNLEKRIEIWHGLMWATYFSVLYDTGFRPSECAALRVSDIYQSSRGLSVGTSHTVNREEGEVVERVKTSDDGGYDKRMGLLYDDTAELLIRLIKEDGLKGDDYLFRAPERENGVLLPDSSNKHFKTVLKEQGVYDEGLVQYGLRHSYMTARRGEMPDEILAISMGHTKLRDDYDHRSMTDLIRQLDDRRDSFFESRKHIDDEPEIRKFKP